MPVLRTAVLALGLAGLVSAMSFSETGDGVLHISRLTPHSRADFSIIPRYHGENITLTFDKADLPVSGCDAISIAVYNGGRKDASRLQQTFCNSGDLTSARLTNTEGFFLEILAGTSINGGDIVIHAHAHSGVTMGSISIFGK